MWVVVEPPPADLHTGVGDGRIQGKVCNGNWDVLMQTSTKSLTAKVCFIGHRAK